MSWRKSSRSAEQPAVARGRRSPRRGPGRAPRRPPACARAASRSTSPAGRAAAPAPPPRRTRGSTCPWCRSPRPRRAARSPAPAPRARRAAPAITPRWRCTICTAPHTVSASSVPARDEAARLERMGAAARQPDARRTTTGAARKRGRPRRPPLPPLRHDVAARSPRGRSARRGRGGLDVDHRGQRLVLDADQVERVLRAIDDRPRPPRPPPRPTKRTRSAPAAEMRQGTGSAGCGA